MKTFPLLFMLVPLIPLHSQSIDPGTRASALAGHQAALIDGAGTLYANPALLAEPHQASLLLEYFQPFQLPGVAGKTIGASTGGLFPISIAAGITDFGNRLYREQVFSAGLARRTLRALAIGIRLNWLRTAIINYANWNEFTLDAGITAGLSPGLRWGLLVKALQTGRSSSMELRTGIAWILQQKNTVFIEVVNSEQPKEVALSAAFELFLHPRFALQAGTGYNTPGPFSAGFQLIFEKIHLNYALQMHAVLPATHRFAISYRGTR